MNQDQAEELALDILEKGRYLAKDRFPVPDTKTVQAWSEVVGRYNLPDWLWLEAVTIFCTEKITQRMVTPLDIIEAARAAKTRWEQSPEGRAAIAKARGGQPTTQAEIEAYYSKTPVQREETPGEYQQRVHPELARMIAEMTERRTNSPPYRAEPGHWWSPKKL